jgi:hypothetical protein
MPLKSIIRKTLGVKRYLVKEVSFNDGKVVIQLDIRKGWRAALRHLRRDGSGAGPLAIEVLAACAVVGHAGDIGICSGAGNLPAVRKGARGSHPLEPGQEPIVGGAHLDVVRLVQAASLAAGGQVVRSALEHRGAGGPPGGSLRAGAPANGASALHRHRRAVATQRTCLRHQRL